MDQNRFVTWLRSHPWTVGIVLVILIVLGFSGYVAIRVVSMGNNLLKLNDSAGTIVEHARSGDLDQLTADLNDAAHFARAAKSDSESVAVSVASALPVYGADVSALRTVSQVSADLIRSAQPVVALVPSLTNTETGGFNTSTLSTLTASMASLTDSLESARSKVGAIDADSLVDPLGSKVATLADGLNQASASLGKLEPFIAALPIILGADGEHTWFVVMQNLAESRPSGGLLSSYIVLHADNGKLEIQAQGANDDFAGRMPDSAFPEELRELWGASLTDILNLNLAAHFPYNAAAVADAWRHVSGESVDGVVSFGQGIVQYLAAATGPVDVRGKTIQPGELSEYLTTGVYADYPDASEKDQVVAEIIGTVFGKLASGQFDLPSLVSSALTQDTADYIQMWSSVDSVEAQIERAGFSGELSADSGNDVTVRFNNLGHNKLDAFLKVGVDYSLGECVAETDFGEPGREASVTVSVTNDSPTSGLPSYVIGERVTDDDGRELPVGTNRWLVNIYAPANSIVDKVTVDGVESDEYDIGTERDHDFVIVDVTGLPGSTHEIHVDWQQPTVDESGFALTAAPTVTMPPLLTSAQITTSSSGRCGD